jgi:hypothetical protein
VDDKQEYTILGWFQKQFNSFIYGIDDSGERLTPKKPIHQNPIDQFANSNMPTKLGKLKFQTHPINGFFSLVFLM